MKTVCFFGIYDAQYNRNQVLLEGFRENGWQVIECQVNPQQFRGVQKYIELYRQARALRKNHIDIVLVAFPGHTMVWVARLLFGKKIIFDVFVSLYDSYVYDRKLAKPYSFKAVIYWLLDWSSCLVAQRVLLDTNAHIAYFVHTFHLPRKKCIKVLAVSNEHIFTPRPETLSEVFTVHFHGTFIPLQGISYIVEAAYLLKDEPIAFRFVGGGQEFSSIQKKAAALNLSNITFIPYVPLEQLPTYIASAHLCLGIFGDTEKTQRVIPNKVFECMAIGKAVITADTPAIRELQRLDVLPLCLIPAANAQALAEAIRELHANTSYRDELGKNAYIFSRAHLNPTSIVKELIKNLDV